MQDRERSILLVKTKSVGFIALIVLLLCAQVIAADSTGRTPSNAPVSQTLAEPGTEKKLSYPLRPSDREIMRQRIAKLERGMTPKEALRVLAPMEGFPTPVWDIPG